MMMDLREVVVNVPADLVRTCGGLAFDFGIGMYFLYIKLSLRSLVS